MDEVNLEKGNGKSCGWFFIFIFFIFLLVFFSFNCVFGKKGSCNSDAYISTTQIATNNAF